MTIPGGAHESRMARLAPIASRVESSKAPAQIRAEPSLNKRAPRYYPLPKANCFDKMSNLGFLGAVLFFTGTFTEAFWVGTCEIDNLVLVLDTHRPDFSQANGDVSSIGASALKPCCRSSGVVCVGRALRLTNPKPGTLAWVGLESE